MASSGGGGGHEEEQPIQVGAAAGYPSLPNQTPNHNTYPPPAVAAAPGDHYPPPPIPIFVPPPQGYPPPQPPYPGYPSPNPYPYTAAPPAAYYGTPQPYLPPPPHHHRRLSGGRAFARGFFLMMIILVSFALLMSLVSWLIFGSALPVFKVDSLTVPDLHISNKSTLNATWYANLTAKNLNRKMDVFFYHIEAAIIHDDDDLLAISLVEPFHLAKLQGGNLSTSLTALSLSVGEQAAKDIERQRATGTVVFHLRMVVSASYTLEGSMWKRLTRFRVFCDGLTVEFAPNNGVGRLKHGAPKECLVYE